MKNIYKLLLSLIFVSMGLFVFADEPISATDSMVPATVAEESPAVSSEKEPVSEKQDVVISEEAINEAVNALKPVSLVKNHPIDIQEQNCRAAAQNPEQIIDCLAKSITNWSYETAKYYSLLHKKLKGDDKTAVYESQKYWNLTKNNDFKVIDSLYDDEQETIERLVCQVEQKRDILKNRAQLLHSFYVQSFPETENPDEKIPVDSVYKPDNFVIRALRYIGF